MRGRPPVRRVELLVLLAEHDGWVQFDRETYRRLRSAIMDTRRGTPKARHLFEVRRGPADGISGWPVPELRITPAGRRWVDRWHNGL